MDFEDVDISVIQRNDQSSIFDVNAIAEFSVIKNFKAMRQGDLASDDEDDDLVVELENVLKALKETPHIETVEEKKEPNDVFRLMERLNELDCGES